MPNTKSAAKRVRSSKRREQINRLHRGRARTADKKARRLLREGQLEEAREAVRNAQAAFDKAAKKGVIHPNKADRRKSRLMQQLRKLEAQES